MTRQSDYKEYSEGCFCRELTKNGHAHVSCLILYHWPVIIHGHF